MLDLYFLDSIDFPLIQCNCNGNMLINDKDSYPDYESCREKCKETDGCSYFGVWNNILPSCELDLIDVGIRPLDVDSS